MIVSEKIEDTQFYSNIKAGVPNYSLIRYTDYELQLCGRASLAAASVFFGKIHPELAEIVTVAKLSLHSNPTLVN